LNHRGFTETRIPAWLRFPSEAPGDQQLPRWAFPVCTLLALTAVWWHRYPAGVDLPQHAHLYKLWWQLREGPIEYQRLYRYNFFTPYLLPYALGVLLTKAVSALFAVKCILSLTAVATPLMMARWLKTIGANPMFGLFGFVLAFDLTYLWGFISHGFAMPLLFWYLAVFEQQYERPTNRGILCTTVLGLAIFLSHGMVFGMAMLVSGVSYLFRCEVLKKWRAGIHLVPLALMAVAWGLMRRREGTSPPREWFIDTDRLLSLFSGPFMPTGDVVWATVGVAILLVLAIVGRPRLVFSVTRAVPLTLSLVLFVVLPEWIASTFLVGTRFCVFVHGFAPAVFAPRTDGLLGRNLPRVVSVLVVACLVVLNVRLARFNQEAGGLDELGAALAPQGDVMQLVTKTERNSAVFGRAQFGQMPAWLTAKSGNLLENDSALYFQMPVRRNPKIRPTRYRYIIARGDLARAKRVVRHYRPGAQFVRAYGKWLLFEERPPKLGPLTIVRDAQGWKSLVYNRSVTGAALRINGRVYSQGLGAHAPSFIRVRADQGGTKLAGSVGVDDGSQGRAAMSFRIRDSRAKVLFQSKEMTSNVDAAPFSIPLDESRELLLEVLITGSASHAHASWVDLHLE
jgi:hypothetical protein